MSNTATINHGSAGGSAQEFYLTEEHHVENGTMLGFWLYLMSDCLIFACLFAMYGLLGGNYAAGPSPGEIGTAVLAGHADTPRGTAVFFRLATLTPGQTITIEREDGHTAHFTIDAVESHPKDAFPSNRVYAPANRPELRLITCGGAFLRDRGGYQDNTVVFAHLTTPANP